MNVLTAIQMADQASRLENQDAIDAAIVGMLADPKEARAGIQEVHFLPFNHTGKMAALTYIESDGKMHRVNKGAPEPRLLLWVKRWTCHMMTDAIHVRKFVKLIEIKVMGFGEYIEEVYAVYEQHEYETMHNTEEREMEKWS